MGTVKILSSILMRLARELPPTEKTDSEKFRLFFDPATLHNFEFPLKAYSFTLGLSQQSIKQCQEEDKTDLYIPYGTDSN
jgi:hypothetical protein